MYNSELSIEKIDSIKSVIKSVIDFFGLSDAQIEYEDSVKFGHVFNISTRDSFLLIGRQGTTLKALEDISIQIVRSKLGEFIRFTIDIDDYRRKRDWYLKETVKAAITKLNQTGKPLSLEPMPNYERKLIHTFVEQAYPSVTSESIGFGGKRKVILKQKKTP